MKNCFNKNGAEDVFNDFVNSLHLKHLYSSYFFDRTKVSDNYSYIQYIDKTFGLANSCKYYYI